MRLWHGHVKEECLHFFVFFKPAVKPGVFDISVVFKWQQNWHKKDILKQQQSHPLQKTRAFCVGSPKDVISTQVQSTQHRLLRL